MPRPFSHRLPSRPRRAFTLVELLVVILIIALLATVALVSFRAVMRRANRAAATSTLRTIGETVQVYASNNNGVYPGREGESPALEETQTADVRDPYQLAFYLSQELWDSNMPESERASQTILREYVHKTALPFVEMSGGESRDLYFLYHVSTEDDNPMPGGASIDPSTSVWGRKGASISFDKTRVPMLSDTYLSAAWNDYKGDDQQTFWGDSLNVLFYDGHVEAIKLSKYEWIEALPAGGK